MPTLEDITTRYRNFSDEELFEVHAKIDEYTAEAKKAFEIVVAERGGLESLTISVEQQRKTESEIAVLKGQIVQLLDIGKTPADIRNILLLTSVTPAQLDTLIQESVALHAEDKADRKIKPRTVLGGILGGFIGGFIGGILWGIQMIYSKHMFVIFLIGLVFLSYAFIRLFTRQSRKNVVVIILTVISVLFALVLGQILYEIFGYMGAAR